jgi:hypothetical protein
MHIFLTSALVGGEWSVSRPGRFTPQRKSPRYPLDMRLGGPQKWPGQRGEEKMLELRSQGCPDRRESLYRLCSPDYLSSSYFIAKLTNNFQSILEMFTAVKITLFRDMTPRSTLQTLQCFGTTYCVHFMIRVWWKDGESRFLRNVGKYIRTPCRHMKKAGISIML